MNRWKRISINLNQSMNQQRAQVETLHQAQERQKDNDGIDDLMDSLRDKPKEVGPIKKMFKAVWDIEKKMFKALWDFVTLKWLKEYFTKKMIGGVVLTLLCAFLIKYFGLN